MLVIQRMTKRLGRMAKVRTIWLALLVSYCLFRAVESHSPHGTVDIEDNEFADFEEFDEPTDESLSGNGSPKLRQTPPPGGTPKKADPSPSSEEQQEVPRKAAPAYSSNSNDNNNEDDVGGGGGFDEDDEFRGIQVDDEEDEQDGLVQDDENDEYDIEDPEKDDGDFGQLNKAGGGNNGGKESGGGMAQGPLVIQDIPAHLRNNWSNYQVELLMLCGLAVYLVNYIWGRSRNQTIAQAWFQAHRDLLEQQFSLVGDDGVSGEVGVNGDANGMTSSSTTATAAASGGPAPSSIGIESDFGTTNYLMRETDSNFAIWCSGRGGCEGMLIQIRLLKRQDLVSLIAHFMRPKLDKLVIRVDLEAAEMDSFVFAMGNKKAIAKIHKEMTDLSQYCSEKKNTSLPNNFSVLSEIAEATSAMVDPKVTTILEKYENCIDYIHFSDQYSGPKLQEGETQSKLPDTTKVLIFSLNMRVREGELEQLRPLLSLIFYYIDKVRRFRLSREGKIKGDKNRQSAAESFLKTTHSQRQEAAQQRREDRVRERKERLMAEEDPEKQRRLEQIEKKRDAKKKQPKMKQLKIKAM